MNNTPRNSTVSRKRRCGWLAGAMLGACLLGAGEAGAQSLTQMGEAGAVEGSGIQIRYNLPSFPHEQRLTHSGYSGVRYKLYTSDGTATGQLNVPLFASDADIDEDTDYIGVAGGRGRSRATATTARRWC